jgi:hypothetical protein
VLDTLASDKARCSAAASSETTAILFKLQGYCMWLLARRVCDAVSGKAKPNTVWCTHVYLRAKALIVFCYNDLRTAVHRGAEGWKGGSAKVWAASLRGLRDGEFARNGNLLGNEEA